MTMGRVIHKVVRISGDAFQTVRHIYPAMRNQHVVYASMCSISLEKMDRNVLSIALEILNKAELKW